MCHLEIPYDFSRLQQLSSIHHEYSLFLVQNTMAEAQNQHSPWSVLALERRLEALCIPAMAVTGVAVILIQLAEKWVHDGPFPTDMKERFLKLYGWGSFGVLKFAVRCSCS